MSIVDFEKFKNDGKYGASTELLDYVVLEVCSRVKSAFALKGGYALSKYLSEPRSTIDVDLSIGSAEAYAEFKKVLTDIGIHLEFNGVIDRFHVKGEISETESGGADYYLNNRKVFGVDISLHQIAFGVDKVNIDIGDVYMFSKERMLADKISVILSERRFRRTKDIYDLYCIVDSFDVDYEQLNSLLAERLRGKEELWDNIPFDDEVIQKLAHAYDKFIPQSMFSDAVLEKPNFYDVYSTFLKFVSPCKFGEKKTKWDCKRRAWF